MKKSIKKFVKCKKQVGFLESVKLKCAGYIDGTRGLPKMTDNNCWNSAFINREINGYEELCSYIWAIHQLESKESYIRLDELTGNILQTKEFLKEAKYDLSVAGHDEEHSNVVRKNGEEKLTDAQVQFRRANEKEKHLAQFRSRVSVLEGELASGIAEFSELYGRLAEDDNTIRMICHCLKTHTLQRLDVYWNAALKKHPASGTMPAVLKVEVILKAEQKYIEMHKKKMDKAKMFIAQMLNDFDKEAA